MKGNNKVIYYRWSGNIKYEFYIETKRTKTHEELRKEISEMFIIYLAGKKVCVNKRGRLKRLLLNPPEHTVIGIGRNWCWLSEDDRRLSFELELDEFKTLLKKYDISEMLFLE